MKRPIALLLLFVSAVFTSGYFAGTVPSLKGEWIAINTDSLFYKSDTLVLMKCMNIDKEGPRHHGRGFIEYTYAMQHYTDFFRFRLKTASVLKMSNIINNKTDTATEYIFHDGTWEMEGRLFKIRSRDFRLNYAYLSSEKGIFTVNGKVYTTVFLKFRRLFK